MRSSKKVINSPMEDLHFKNNNDKDEDNGKQINGRNVSFGDANITENGSFKSFSDYEPDKIEAGEIHNVRQPIQKPHINPVDAKENSSNAFPAPSPTSTAHTDQQRQILILMLLAQVCAMHDSTPKTFTIHLLSLYERGILDHDNSIGFLFDMGLVPKRLRLNPANIPAPEVIPVSQSQSQSRSQPPSHNKDQSIQQESRTENDNAAIVPYNTPPDTDGNKKTGGIQTTRSAEAHSRIRQVHTIRQHLESQEPSLKNSSNISTKDHTEANFTSIQKIIEKPHSSYHQLVTSAVTTAEHPPLSSWAVEDHPLSVSRYSRDFIQRKLLAFGSFGEVFLATNKLDNCDYAIKKIVFAAKGYDTKEVEIVIKEVKCLAKLNHENVVRYYTSWLEPTWITGSNTASPTNNVDGQNLYEGGDEEKVGVSCPDEVASKDVQKEMLISIQQLVYGDKQEKLTADNRILDQSETSIEPSMLKGYASTADYGHGGGLCAWSFNSSNGNQTRDVDSWNQLASHDNDNNPISLNTISTGEYGEESECSEWTKDQQSSTGNIHIPDLYSYRQEQHNKEKKREKSYRYEICLFIQMQLCHPSTLADWMRSRNKRENQPNNSLTRNWCKHYEDAWDIFLQIVRGLMHIHSQGVIHRDLKPANIFSADDGLFKIGDFGLSTMLKKLSSTIPTDGGLVGENDDVADYEVKDVADNVTALTLVSKYKQFSHNQLQDLTAGVGTATYAAPEQIVSNSYGAKADIFSLGLILLELFCSFGSEHERADTFHDCRRGKLPSWIISTYPFKNVADLITSCTKPNPLDRPTGNEILKLNIYKETLAMQKGMMTNSLESELRRRDEVIVEQSRLLLEKDALLKKQTEDLKQMKDSLECLMNRSDHEISDS